MIIPELKDASFWGWILARCKKSRKIKKKYENLSCFKLCKLGYGVFFYFDEI